MNRYRRGIVEDVKLNSTGNHERRIPDRHTDSFSPMSPRSDAVLGPCVAQTTATRSTNLTNILCNGGELSRMRTSIEYLMLDLCNEITPEVSQRTADCCFFLLYSRQLSSSLAVSEGHGDDEHKKDVHSLQWRRTFSNANFYLVSDARFMYPLFAIVISLSC